MLAETLEFMLRQHYLLRLSFLIYRL
jgi:hypothetical protein